MAHKPAHVVMLFKMAALASLFPGSHGSGTYMFEWGGVFSTVEQFYVWTAQKASGTNYADAHMKLAVLPAASSTDAAFDALKAKGNYSLTFECTEVDTNELIVPKEDVCYELHFDTRSWQSLFILNTAGVSNVAIFTQHDPSEFERDTHYLKNQHGCDVNPVHTHPESASHDHDRRLSEHANHNQGSTTDVCAGANVSSSSHAHGEHEEEDSSSAWEWAGLFLVAKDYYVWTAQTRSITGTYADAHMKIAVLPATTNSDAALSGLAGEGSHSLSMNCTEVEAGGIITPKEDACYELHFDIRMWQSLFLINMTGVDYAAIFTQHAPSEFERDTHYLKVREPSTRATCCVGDCRALHVVRIAS